MFSGQLALCRESVEVERLAAQDLGKRALKQAAGVGRGIGLFLLERVPDRVDAVAHRIGKVEAMRPLQEIDANVKHVAGAERQVIGKDGKLVGPVRETDLDAGLQPGHDIVGNFEGGGILVHGDHGAEFFVRLHDDAGDYRFRRSPVVKESGKRGPRFFGHAVALVEHRDAAFDGRGQQGTGMIGEFSVARKHGSNEQVLRAACLRCIASRTHPGRAFGLP